MSRPKFSIGEEVSVVTISNPVLGTPKTEVTDCLWVKRWEDDFPACWGYATAHDSSPGLFPECSLRKLSPEDRTSWTDCAWQPKELAHDD